MSFPVKKYNYINMELGLSFWITVSLMSVMIVGGMIFMFIGMKKNSLYEISKDNDLDNFTDKIYKSSHVAPDINKEISNLIDEEFESIFNLKSISYDFENATKYIQERKTEISKLINDYRNGIVDKVEDQSFDKVLLAIEKAEKIINKCEKNKEKIRKKHSNDKDSLIYINYKFNDTIDYMYTLIYYFKEELLKQKYIIKKEIETINNIEKSNNTFF